MKLNHIYNVLAENKINLNLVKEKVPNTNLDRYQFPDIQPLLHSFRAIGDLNVFESINRFKEKYPDFYFWNNEIYADTNGVTATIQEAFYAIADEVDSVTNILEKFIPEDEGYIISVKLPEYESLNKLPRFYKELDTMLTPLVKYFGDDTLTIHSFENGSKWNDFLVKNKETISIILLILTSGASLCASITEIQKNKLEMQKTYVSMQQDCLSQNLPDEINTIFEKQVEYKYDEYTNKFFQILEEEEIEINTRGSAEEEIRTVIKRSFKSYQFLATEGTQFYGQLNTEDESVKKLAERLDSSQKVLINLKEFQALTEGKVKSLVGFDGEVSIDTENEN